MIRLPTRPLLAVALAICPLRAAPGAPVPSKQPARPVTLSQVSPAADDAYRAAGNLLGAGRWLEAAGSYARFAREFPDDPRAPSARFRRGEALFRAGRLDEALAAFDAAGDDPRARFRVANTLYLLGRPADATEAFRSLLATGKQEKEKKLPEGLEGPARYFLARSLLARGNADGAKKVLEAFRGRAGAAYVKLALGDVEAALEGKEHLDGALSAYRDALETATAEALARHKGRLVPETLFRIGDLLRRSGRGEEAAKHYLRAAEAAPSGPVAPYARLGAAWARLQSGDAEGAAKEASAAAALAEAAGARDPRLGPNLIDEVAYVRGAAELAAGRYEAASRSLAPLLGRKTPTIPRDRLLQRLAWSATFAGRGELAARAASALLAMGPPAGRAAEARLVLADSELASGRPAKALKEFAAAGGDGKVAALAAYGRAKALSALGKALEAAGAFDGFSREFEGHALVPAAKALSARAYLAAGEAGRAAERFREARAAYAGGPLEAEIVWGASLAEYMRGDFEAMAALDREIVERFPGSDRAADAAYWFAWSRLERKDFKGAAEAFRDAAGRAKGRPRLAAAAALERASALERAGDTGGALEVALDLVTGDLAPHAPLEAVLWTAEALRRNGDTGRAIGILDAALERAAGGGAASRVLYARAELLRAAGETDGAIGLYDRILAAAPGGELAAASRLGKARCLSAGGRRAEAEVLLENALDGATGWARAAVYHELGELRLDRAGESEGEKRKVIARRAAEDFMFVVLLYEPEGPGEGARLSARALLGAAGAYVLLERYAPARERLEQLITHPLYGTLPEAREARRLLQKIPVEALGTRE